MVRDWEHKTVRLRSSKSQLIGNSRRQRLWIVDCQGSENRWWLETWNKRSPGTGNTSWSVTSDERWPETGNRKWREVVRWLETVNSLWSETGNGRWFCDREQWCSRLQAHNYRLLEITAIRTHLQINAFTYALSTGYHVPQDTTFRPLNTKLSCNRYQHASICFFSWEMLIVVMWLPSHHTCNG